MMKFIENRARRVAELYGFKEIMTPIVEPYELLAAKAGEEVRSRMFVFKDLGGRNVALRPEFTASVARFVTAALQTKPKPFRLFNVGTVYRYDEPQKGRYREIWQSNYELMGSNRPEADAEIILLTNSLMETSGLKNLAFKVGHVGVLRGIFSQEKLEEKVQNSVMQLMDKKQYEDALKLVKDAGASKNCMNTLRELIELKGNDVFGIVGKMQKCVEDYSLAVEATRNLYDILRLVTESGIKMCITIEAGFARGLEYYTGVIFEVSVPELDVALGGGGRYDRLIELFGGEPTAAVGVAHGIDRIMLALQTQKAKPDICEEKTGVIIPIKEELKGEALRIAQTLRGEGIPVELEVMGRKVAKALEDANRKNLDFAIIVGEKELKEGAIAFRDLKRRTQSTVKIEQISKIAKET